jgi:hypothetical protein
MSSSKSRIAAGITVLYLFAACGSTSKPTGQVVADAGQAGQAGETSGAGEVPEPVPCGSATCQAIVLPNGAVTPCCVNPLEGICGARLGIGLPGTSPAMTCQPLTQAGQLDLTCPASTGGTVGGFPLPPFPGCCREATGQCGYLVTDIGGLLPFAPGCVDATPFLNGADPVACGAGAMPGAAGAGGVPSTSDGGASAGGVPNDGGASSAAGNSGHAGDPGAGGGDLFERR